jgi:ribose transport system substrate-binding protein
MTRSRYGVILVASVGAAALALTSCSSSSTSSESTSAAAAATSAAAAASSAAPAASSAAPAASSAASAAASGGVPSWCGPNEITLGFADGFGGNSWRLVTTESGKDEAAKCPSVKELIYTDGQGDLQKSISDIQGMVAKGVNALVVFPDASEAILPTLKEAFDAGVITVPYRVFPGGKDGVDYTKYIALDAANDGHNYADFFKKALPDGGNILVLSGPKGNSQGTLMAEELRKELGAEGDKYKFIGESPFEVTNWDPALSQKVLTAAIAKYPQIDGIASDFGPSLVGALPEFTKAGKKIPVLATSDGNVLGCFWEDQKAAGNEFPMMTVQTGNDHARTAIDYAVAEATGGTVPAATAHQHQIFEDSLDTTKPVQCRKDLPGDIYLSAQLPAEAQAALMK